MAPLINYPRVIAHRCGGALAPENSLAGLTIAARLGCLGVEFDVMLSADEVPLVIHDETLQRTTTGSGEVAKLSADQIRSFDLGRPHHPAFSPACVPLFDEALDELARLRLWANVEIKPARGCEVQTGIRVARRLAESASFDGVVSSFSHEALVAARGVAPNLPIALLFERLPENWREQQAQLNAVAVHLAARHADETSARDLGNIPWACYTVNTRTEADRLFRLGCAAIFTDRPDLWT